MTRNLKDILYKVNLISVIGKTDSEINEIHFNSKEITNGDVFVAIKGNTVDGHKFIDNALDNGARAIVCEDLPLNIHKDVVYVQVENSQKALAYMAANFYDNPSENFKLIGITGTNGKTTVATLLYNLFKLAGFKVGLLSTVKVMIDAEEIQATHTTPDSKTINRHLKAMVDYGVEYCFMEVSSHGIDQHRTTGLYFKGGIFTNLSHDHLDYHSSFKEYRDVKKRFFDELPSGAFALTNSDDKNGKYMQQNTRAKKYTYALKSFADYRAQILENQFEGLLLKINGLEVWSRLIGQFNAYNVLAVYATANLLELSEQETLRYISQLESVSGRFQYLISGERITAIVDYAHTPDALKNVLETINSIRTKNEELITVVGCGGNRDKTKRPKMGHIASSLSDKAIFTSDNPRNEDPEAIIKEMEEGIEPQNFKKVLTITHRDQAIKTACQLANAGDIILVAGKGHEAYQEIKGERTEFDDFKKVKEYLKQLQK